MLNGNRIGSGTSEDVTNVFKWDTYSLQSTLNLQAGDQIWWQIGSMSPGFTIYHDGWNHFTGFLLEEEITDSLKTL